MLFLFVNREHQLNERHHDYRRGVRGHRPDVRRPTEERLGTPGRHHARLQRDSRRMAGNHSDTFRKCLMHRVKSDRKSTCFHTFH